MVTATAPRPSLDLNVPRILATSLVIACHAAAALLLLAPIALPEPTVVPEQITQVTFQAPPLPPIPPPPVPIPPTAHPIAKPVPVVPSHRPDLAPPSDDAPPTDEGTPIARDVVVPVAPVDHGEPAPSVQTLTTDRAPAPPYPPMAERRRITGTVVLLILVDATGAPAQVDVERSSGSKLLDEAAQTFVRRRWHFVPSQRDGVAVSAYARVPIHFTL